MHVIYPPKFYITIVFNFSWDEKLETIVMHFFFVGKGGGGELHYCLCENGELSGLKTLGFTSSF